MALYKRKTLLISSHLRMSFDLPVIWGALCGRRKRDSLFYTDSGTCAARREGPQQGIGVLVKSAGASTFGFAFHFHHLAPRAWVSSSNSVSLGLPICKMRKVIISIADRVLRMTQRMCGKCLAWRPPIPQKRFLAKEVGKIRP